MKKLREIIHNTQIDEITIKDQEFLMRELSGYLLPVKQAFDRVQDEIEKDLGATLIGLEFKFDEAIAKVLRDCPNPLSKSEH
ncbi:hypothetical protein [Algoriphagus sp.]|uniref:hypothetical protein n=1 Tax=Algoriphagus sp. TaxID=1872435 RepID=UPI003F6F28A9